MTPKHFNSSWVKKIGRWETFIKKNKCTYTFIGPSRQGPLKQIDRIALNRPEFFVGLSKTLKMVIIS